MVSSNDFAKSKFTIIEENLLSFYEKPVKVAFILAITNALLVVIYLYNFSVITIGCYFILSLFILALVFYKIRAFIYNDLKRDLEEDSFFIPENYLRGAYAFVFETINGLLQSFRDVILLKSWFLTIKWLVIIYIISLAAYYLGDYAFFGFGVNVVLVSPFVFLNYKSQLEGSLSNVKNLAFEKYDLISSKIPKHEKRDK